jgi:hypothetical protein
MKITDIEDNSLFTELTNEEAANITGGFGFPSFKGVWDALKQYGEAVAQPFISMGEDALHDPFHFLDHLGQRNDPGDNDSP